MFNQLIESKRRKQKSMGGTVFSFVFHSAVIGAAVVAPAKAGIADDKTKQEKIQFVEMKKEPQKPKEPPPPPPPPKEVMKAPPPKAFQVMRAPVELPIKLPDIDLHKEVHNEEHFSRKVVKVRIAKGVEGGTQQTITAQPYIEFQFDEEVEQIPGTETPRDPDAL